MRVKHAAHDERAQRSIANLNRNRRVAVELVCDLTERTLFEDDLIAQPRLHLMQVDHDRLGGDYAGFQTDLLHCADGEPPDGRGSA